MFSKGLLIVNIFFPDIGISNTTITNTVWRLLEYFTLKHENSDNCELHRAVAQKLLQDGAFLPQWLLISYKVSVRDYISSYTMSTFKKYIQKYCRSEMPRSFFVSC